MLFLYILICLKVIVIIDLHMLLYVQKGFLNDLAYFHRNGLFYACLQGFYVHMCPYLVHVVVLAHIDYYVGSGH